jgi:hypothetical protein
MANGYLDESTLVMLDNFLPLDDQAKGLVLPEVAWQWHLMCEACLRETGYVLYASEGYRNFAGQVFQKVRWTALGKPGNAALPGTSTHGDARAIDAGSGAGTDGSPVENWLQANMAKYGFSRPFSYELWHLLYVGGATITKEEEDMTPAQDTKLTQALQKLDALAPKVDSLTRKMEFVEKELRGAPDAKQTRLQEAVIGIRALTTGDSRLKEAVIAIRAIAAKLGVNLKK